MVEVHALRLMSMDHPAAAQKLAGVRRVSHQKFQPILGSLDESNARILLNMLKDFEGPVE